MFVLRAELFEPLFAVARARGADMAPLLARVGLQRQQIRAGAYVFAQAFEDLLDACSAEWAMSDVGLRMGKASDISVLGPIGLAMMYASTGREALEIAARNLHLINSRWKVLLSRDHEPNAVFVELQRAYSLARQSPHEAECTALCCYRFTSQLSGTREPPQAVWFRHAPLSPRAVYVDAFGIAPHFEMPAHGIAFADGYLDGVNPSKNAGMLDIATRLMERVQPVPQADDLVQQVSAMCEAGILAGLGTQKRIAAQLKVGERTLQRRLQARGVTFEQIKDEARKNLAERLLARLDLSIGDVSAMLGYAEATAFNRSCRRWFGAAPSQVRKRAMTEKMRD